MRASLQVAKVPSSPKAIPVGVRMKCQALASFFHAAVGVVPTASRTIATLPSSSAQPWRSACVHGRTVDEFAQKDPELAGAQGMERQIGRLTRRVRLIDAHQSDRARRSVPGPELTTVSLAAARDRVTPRPELTRAERPARTSGQERRQQCQGPNPERDPHVFLDVLRASPVSSCGQNKRAIQHEFREPSARNRPCRENLERIG